MTSQVTNPFPIFTSRVGVPLTGGFIYVGTVNNDPETNPVAVYWDAAKTQPAAQPIRTIGGYPSNNGTPARLYADGPVSIRVRDLLGVEVFYLASFALGVTDGAGTLAFTTLRTGTTLVPADQLVITTAYHTYPGFGGARYVRNDTLVTPSYATANPLVSFRAPDETGSVHGYILDNNPVFIEQCGAVPSSISISTAQDLANANAWYAARRLNRPFTHGPGNFWVPASMPGKGAILEMWEYGQGGTCHFYGPGHNNGRICRNTDDTHRQPMFGMPEVYYDAGDDVFRLPNGNLAPAGLSGIVLPADGRNYHLHDLFSSNGFGKFTTAVFTVNTLVSKIDQIAISGAGCGIWADQGFNYYFSNIMGYGLFYASGRTQAQIEDDFHRFPLLQFSSHARCDQITGKGWGTGISVTGFGFQIGVYRLEVNECAIDIGRAERSAGTWNGTAFSGPGYAYAFTIEAGTIESCRNPYIFNNSARATVGPFHITGGSAVEPGPSPNEPLVNGYRRVFAYVYTGAGCESTFEIRDFVTGGLAPLQAEVVTLGNATIKNANYNSRIGATHGLSRFGPYRAERINMAPLLNGSHADIQKYVGFNTQTVLTQLTALRRGETVVGTNFGRREYPTTGATSMIVPLLAPMAATNAAFSTAPAAVTDGTSTLSAGRYFIASTLIAPDGSETGVGSGYVPFSKSTATITTPLVNFYHVDVTAGQAIDVARVGTGANAKYYTWRVYVMSSRGIPLYYYEMPATTTTFRIKGQTTGQMVKDLPPLDPAQTTDQREVDANYGVFLNDLTWAAGNPRVEAADRLTNQFTVKWDTAAPSGAFFSWLLPRTA